MQTDYRVNDHQQKGDKFLYSHSAFLQIIVFYDTDRWPVSACVIAASVEGTGASFVIHASPPKYCWKIFSAVRVASACVVRVGFGPPIPLASAELSAMNSRLASRASQLSSRTESEALNPMRMVLWL